MLHVKAIQLGYRDRMNEKSGKRILKHTAKDFPALVLGGTIMAQKIYFDVSDNQGPLNSSFFFFK